MSHSARMFSIALFILIALNVISASAFANSLETVWTFAYGANMNIDTLKSRGATPLQSVPAKLQNWELQFNMIGIPWIEPAFGNIEPNLRQVVHGVAHLMTREQFQKLREYEGGGGYSGQGYDVLDLDVETYDGKKITAKTFVTVPSWKHMASPSRRYIEILIKGAQQNHIKDEYLHTVLINQKTY